MLRSAVFATYDVSSPFFVVMLFYFVIPDIAFYSSFISPHFHSTPHSPRKTYFDSGKETFFVVPEIWTKARGRESYVHLLLHLSGCSSPICLRHFYIFPLLFTFPPVFGCLSGASQEVRNWGPEKKKKDKTKGENMCFAPTTHALVLKAGLGRWSHAFPIIYCFRLFLFKFCCEEEFLTMRFAFFLGLSLVNRIVFPSFCAELAKKLNQMPQNADINHIYLVIAEFCSQTHIFSLNCHFFQRKFSEARALLQYLKIEQEMFAFCSDLWEKNRWERTGFAVGKCVFCLNWIRKNAKRIFLRNVSNCNWSQLHSKQLLRMRRWCQEGREKDMN